jgi:type I restriction enzyme S subunit
MTTFPKYPKYKDSGVEWLGEVPQHWEVLPGRTCLSLNKEKNGRNIETTVLSLSYGRVVIKPPEKLTGLVPASFEGYQLIQPGDVIIRPTDLQNDTTSLRVGLAKDRGIITSAYLGLRPFNKASSEFLYYLLHAYDLMKVYYGMGTGMRQSLDWRDFKYLNLSLPPHAEQNRIVAFLDEKTAVIDTLIAKKQRQIELLDEQKAILINRAVTRGVPSVASAKTGLHPNPELQDSGIPWIGSIPKHWKVIKLKYLISIQAGYAFASSAYSHNAQDTRLLRGVNVNPGKITWNDVVYWPEKKMRGVEDFALAEDDMVMGMDRPWVSSGVRVARIKKVDLPCLLLQRVARIRATKVEPDFLERVLTGSGFKSYFEPILTGVSVPHISPDQIGCYTAAIPPLSEQKAICSFINQAEALCSKAKASEEAQIQALQTLRSTLIAHAVTGKIKVS